MSGRRSLLFEFVLNADVLYSAQKKMEIFLT